MLTFLFWNLKTKNLQVLDNLVTHHDVDILILAECPSLPGQILEALNKKTNQFYFAVSTCEKINLFTRFSDEFVLPVNREREQISGNDYTFRRLRLPDRIEVLLCAIHFPSKLRQASVDQFAFTTHFAQILAEAEKNTAHCRTILVGDFNMNPYEDSLVASNGLHAVQTRRIAQKERRKVKFESNLYFYNPMWSHFGENEQGHAGSYYYSSPKVRADFWNIYDQVLVRPALLPYFRDDSVKILWQDSKGDIPLIDLDGLPRSDEISDHLPLLFQLDI